MNKIEVLRELSKDNLHLLYQLNKNSLETDPLETRIQEVYESADSSTSLFPDKNKKYYLVLKTLIKASKISNPVALKTIDIPQPYNIYFYPQFTFLNLAAIAANRNETILYICFNKNDPKKMNHEFRAYLKGVQNVSPPPTANSEFLNEKLKMFQSPRLIKLFPKIIFTDIEDLMQTSNILRTNEGNPRRIALVLADRSDNEYHEEFINLARRKTSVLITQMTNQPKPRMHIETIQSRGIVFNQPRGGHVYSAENRVIVRPHTILMQEKGINLNKTTEDQLDELCRVNKFSLNQTKLMLALKKNPDADWPELSTELKISKSKISSIFYQAKDKLPGIKHLQSR